MLLNGAVIASASRHTLQIRGAAEHTILGENSLVGIRDFFVLVASVRRAWN